MENLQRAKLFSKSGHVRLRHDDVINDQERGRGRSAEACRHEHITSLKIQIVFYLDSCKITCV